jgi:hypothetical protein
VGEMGYKATGNADLHSFFVGILEDLLYVT